ncbi:MAG: hypothetical protein KA004_14325 [Verrucomicrobiales bacterium]|nr:hypothetical protein [Verrucomicrobiales bacterium]
MIHRLLFFTTACAVLTVQLPVAGLRAQENASASNTSPGWQIKATLGPAQPEPEGKAPAADAGKKALPPVPYSLRQVTHRVTLTGNAAKMSTLFNGKSFREEPQLIPLLGGSTEIETCEEKGGSVVAHEGKVWIMTMDAAEFEGRVEMSGFLSGSPPTLTLPLVEAISQRIIVSGAPAERRITLNGEEPRRREGDDLVFFAPATGGEAVLRIEEPEAVKPPPVPSKWRLDARVAAVWSDGMMGCEAQMFCQADSGTGLEAVLRLPGNATAVEASGEDLAQHRLLSNKSESGERLVLLTWKTPEILERRVTLHYQIPQSPLAPEWTLHAPGADGETRTFFALAPVEGYEFSAPGIRGPVPASLTPLGAAWAQKGVQFLVAEGGMRLVLKAALLQRVEPVKAAVSKAACRTLLNASGTVAVEARYSVQHRESVRFALEIPQGGTVRLCRVNNADAAPVLRGMALEFQLPAPGKDGISEVTLCYQIKGTPFDPVSGKTALELPKSGLFCDSLTWSLQLPDGYECAAFEGNVEADSTAPAADPHLVSFRKLLGQGEAPAVEVYYQRRGIQE